MKLICKYSGLPLAELSAFSFRHLPGRLPFIESWKESQLLHPVFGLSRYELTRAYSLSKFYTLNSARAFSDTDKQLWFLAATHATNLVIQSAPNLPPAPTAKRYFNRVVKFLDQLDLDASPRITGRFPKLHISKTYDWKNFEGIMEAWEEAQENYHSAKITAIKKENREALQRKIEIKLRKAAIGEANTESSLLQTLWQYVLNDIPEHLLNKKVLQVGLQTKNRTSYPEGSYTLLTQRTKYCYYRTKEDMWKSLFTASQAAISRGDWDKEEIEELEQTVLAYVDQGTIASHGIMKRLNQLYDWYRETTDFLDDISILSIGEGSKDRALKPAPISTNAPVQAPVRTNAPVRADYPSEVAFLVATIKWNKSGAASSATSNPTSNHTSNLGV